MMKFSNKWMVGAVVLAASAAASAQSAGTWSARVGFLNITPQVTSDDLTPPSFPGTKANASGDTQLAGGVSYMLTDHVVIDVPLALPYHNNLTGAGAIQGVGKIGSVESLAMTVFVNYKFMEPGAQVRPYVGFGLTYAKFFNAKGTAALSALTGGHPTTLSIESKFAPTPLIGVNVALNDRWYLDAGLSKTLLKNRTTLSTGQTIDLKLDPVSYGLQLGYKF